MKANRKARGRTVLEASEAEIVPEFSVDELDAGKRLFERRWSFLMGAPSLEFLPPADRPEIAFAGRSNVGKSSLINTLVRQHGLARTSNTPGRTQELNFFQPDGLDVFLVDMPGYGYAKAPREKVESWTMLVRDYLRGRSTLKRVFVLIDARHGIKREDTLILALLDDAAVSYQIVLTKADKVPPKGLAAIVDTVRRDAAMHPAAHPVVHITSAETGLGIESLRAEIAVLLEQ